MPPLSRRHRPLPALLAAAALSFTLLQTAALAAEGAATPQRPRIGLALSGGGARGRASMRRFAKEIMPIFRDAIPVQ